MTIFWEPSVRRFSRFNYRARNCWSIGAPLVLIAIGPVAGVQARASGTIERRPVSHGLPFVGRAGLAFYPRPESVYFIFPIMVLRDRGRLGRLGLGHDSLPVLKVKIRHE